MRTLIQKSFRIQNLNSLNFFNSMLFASANKNFSQEYKFTRNYVGKIKSIILDWSGTTADMHVIAPAVVFFEVFKKHEVPISMKEARLPMGLRKDLHIQKILEIPEVKQRWIQKKGKKPTQQDVDALFKDFVPMQLEVLPKYTKLLPGVAQVVTKFQKDQGIKVGSTTGFTKVMVDILLKDAAKQGYKPDSSVAGDQVSNNMGFRPAPFMIYQNMVNLGVFPVQSVIKVDDTVGGVGEGLNAGCWSVGVYNYSNYTDIDTIEQWEKMSKEDQYQRQKISKEILEKSGAHYVIPSMLDLPAVVQDINQRLSRGEKP